MSKIVDTIIDEIIDQYMYADETNRPWIIGFSGGKDSGVEQFDNLRDAISALSIGMED